MKNDSIFFHTRFSLSSEYEVMVYSCLQMYYLIPFIDSFPIDINDLSYYLFDDFNVSKKTKTNLSNALNSLIDRKIINGKKVTNSHYIIQRDSFELHQGENFTVIHFSDIKKLVKNKKCRLLPYLLNLVSTINNKTKVGNMSSKYLADINNCSIKTVYENNRILEEECVIYIRRSLNGKDKNFYGLYENKKLVDEIANKFNYHNEPNANWQRSVTARYNAFVSGKSFTEDSIVQLYNDCIKYNELMDQKQRLQPSNDYIKKKKDLSIITNKTAHL